LFAHFIKKRAHCFGIYKADTVGFCITDDHEHVSFFDVEVFSEFCWQHDLASFTDGSTPVEFHVFHHKEYPLKLLVKRDPYIIIFIQIIHFILLSYSFRKDVLLNQTQRKAKEKDLKTNQITGPQNHTREWVEPMAIKVFVTGGTFDKEYDMIEGKLFFRDTHLPEMLKLGHCKVDVDIRTLMMIDSVNMKDQDRAIIVENCKNSEEERIVITHGTDTMVETAKRLGEAIKDKTIVLTGAMIPYRFGSSDGLFNLGSALAFVQSLPHGIYVAMNGRYFTYDNVMKNKQLGEFEELKVIQ